MRPPPREEPGRSRRIMVWLGKEGRGGEEEDSLVSCRQATKTNWVWRRREISRWELRIPLQLNCIMVPLSCGVGGEDGGGRGGEGGVEGDGGR